MTSIRSRVRELSLAGRNPVSVTATLADVRRVAPSFVRIRLVAPGLEAYHPTLPADGIKLELPHGGGTSLRAFTVSARTAVDVIEVDALRHDGGVVTAWLGSARPGDELRVHAVRREYAVGDGITSHLVVADASAIPAAASILRAIPTTHRVHAWVQAPSSGDLETLLPGHPGLDLHGHVGVGWGADLASELAPILHLARTERLQAWIAAEAETVASIRRKLLGVGLSRDDLFAAAYWKRGRDESARDRRIMAAYGGAGEAKADLADPDVRAEFEAFADGTA